MEVLSYKGTSRRRKTRKDLTIVNVDHSNGLGILVGSDGRGSSQGNRISAICGFVVDNDPCLICFHDRDLSSGQLKTAVLVIGWSVPLTEVSSVRCPLSDE